MTGLREFVFVFFLHLGPTNVGGLNRKVKRKLEN